MDLAGVGAGQAQTIHSLLYIHKYSDCKHSEWSSMKKVRPFVRQPRKQTEITTYLTHVIIDAGADVVGPLWILAQGEVANVPDFM